MKRKHVRFLVTDALVLVQDSVPGGPTNLIRKMRTQITGDFGQHIVPDLEEKAVGGAIRATYAEFFGARLGS